MNIKYKHVQTFCLSILFMITSVVHANTLDNISYTALPGDMLEIRLTMSETPSLPGSFTIDNPARIAFDLANTNVNLKEKTTNIGVNHARSITAIKAGTRTRVVVNLNKLVNYQTDIDGNDIVIKLNASGSQAPSAPSAPIVGDEVVENIQNIDFRRGEKGEGRVILTLADPNTAVDMKKRGNDVIVTVKDSSIPESLERRLDVLDFATLVKTVDSFNHGNDVRLIISATKEFDHIAYQTKDAFTVDIKPIVKLKKKKSLRKKEYKGERLSLNFQNIDIRAVLQLIADFTGLNLITSDTVKGELTLRLKNVPWDQALDIVLKSKGLGMERQGNVISVAPLEEIAARNKVVNTVQEVAPLASESIQVNYAKASDLAKLIKKSKDTSLLSTRGNISVDERTNKILIQDTVRNIDNVAALVEELDVPVKQVLIESRVVLAGNTFSKELGVRFGVTHSRTENNGEYEIGLSGSDFAANIAKDATNVDEAPVSGSRYNVNLPATNPSGTIGIALSRLPFGTLLDLELSAAQEEGKSETISSPKVVTANQKEAYIEAGTEIPYVEASSSGATSVAFKKAVLSLKVTPQITPDSRIIMDLKVTKDEPDFGNLVLGVPPIRTQQVETQVLVNNGETVVLGGVYERSSATTVNRVPFFGDIPIIGVLFRNTNDIDNKQELLIFVTPKIIKETAKI